MYHKNVTETVRGDNVDVNVDGLTKDNMQRSDEKCIQDPNPLKLCETFTELVIVQDHVGHLKCNQHDTKSDGYKEVYVCRDWTLTYNAMFDQIESLNSCSGAVAVCVLIET